MPIYAQLVIGPAGSGKSTYCNLMQQHMQVANRSSRGMFDFQKFDTSEIRDIWQKQVQIILIIFIKFLLPKNRKLIHHFLANFSHLGQISEVMPKNWKFWKNSSTPDKSWVVSYAHRRTSIFSQNIRLFFYAQI